MYTNLVNCCFGELDYMRDDFHLLVLTFKKCFKQACFNLKKYCLYGHTFISYLMLGEKALYQCVSFIM